MRLIIYIQIISNKNFKKPHASSDSEIVPQEQPYLLWLHSKDKTVKLKPATNTSSTQFCGIHMKTGHTSLTLKI